MLQAANPPEPEVLPMRLPRIAVLLSCLLLAAPALARGGCSLQLKPQTEGFFLNPTLVRVLVKEARPSAEGKTCALQANDEILKINDRVVPGTKAKALMAYWQGLGARDPKVFTVRRAGQVLQLDMAAP